MRILTGKCTSCKYLLLGGGFRQLAELAELNTYRSSSTVLHFRMFDVFRWVEPFLKCVKLLFIIPFNKLHGVSGPLLLALVTQSETAYLRLSLSPSLHLSLSLWSPLQWPWDFAFTTRSRYDRPIRDTHGWTEAHPQTIRKSNHLPMSNSNIATLTYYAVLCPIRKPMLCLKFVILLVSKESFSLFYLCTIPT